MSAKRQPDASSPDLTDDAVLGGRLRLWQPRRGHRFGHDAILLAAATPARDRAVDLGAGVGAAGLALAARVPGLRVTLVDIRADLAALAALNAARNQLAGRVDAVALDVAASAADYVVAGLPPGTMAGVNETEERTGNPGLGGGTPPFPPAIVGTRSASDCATSRAPRRAEDR